MKKYDGFNYVYSKSAKALIVMGFIGVFSYGVWPDLMALIS